MWNQVHDLGNSEKASLKISVYDPRYFMPSQTVMSIQLNRPPSGGTLRIHPASGIAMQTKFQIDFSGFFDTDLPLSYQIITYLAENQYLEDVLKSEQYSQNVMTDFTVDERFELYFPSGLGDSRELLILGRISDAVGGIRNITQKIQVAPNPNLLQSLTLSSINTAYDFALAIELSQATCSDA